MCHVVRCICCFIAVLLFLSACGSSSSQDKQTQPRIINGEVRSQAELPQIVKISSHLASGLGNICTAVVVSEKALLTAAHCVQKADRVFVVIGNDSIQIDQIIVHPHFIGQSNALFNDVAILKTQNSLNLPSLPLFLNSPITPGTEIEIMGYGVDENFQTQGLKSGKMLVNLATENHIFTYFDGSLSNVCFGDSGGPATISYTDPQSSLKGLAVAGITSTGSRSDCKAGAVSLFINIQSESVVRFIFEHVEGVGVV